MEFMSLSFGRERLEGRSQEAVKIGDKTMKRRSFDRILGKILSQFDRFQWRDRIW